MIKANNYLLQNETLINFVILSSLNWSNTCLQKFERETTLFLKNDQLNVEKVKKLEEYSGLEGTAIFDYCAKIGVIGMTTES